MGIVEKFVGGILGSWILIGLIVAILTGNITTDTFTTGAKGFENTGMAIIVWPVPAGQPLCASKPGATDGMQCTGYHLPWNYKLVKTG